MYNKFSYRIHTSSKEYGFGQSLLHEGQLVFHTPPYSLHPVSLQEGHESIGKANIRIARTTADPEQKSPLTHHKLPMNVPCNDSPPQLNKTPSGDKIDRQSYHKIKAKEVTGSVATTVTSATPSVPPSGSASPGTLDRKNRRFSYANSR